MAGLNKETLVVPKTVKLFINGEFPRTESGRSFPVYFHKSKQVFAHLCLASRKDHRAAVTAAKDAQKSWEERTAYNRSQILYRMAEMMEGRRSVFIELFGHLQGLSAKQSQEEVTRAVDAIVYYAGFADKYQQLIGAVNPVAGPHHNFTTPEPVGVVGLICSSKFSLPKIVADISAIICSGNTAVVLLPESASGFLAELGEVYATSDLPKGVINLLSGSIGELYQHFGSHMEIQSLSFQEEDFKKATELKVLASENMKRFVGQRKSAESLENILDFVEYKTVWHPVDF